MARKEDLMSFTSRILLLLVVLTVACAKRDPDQPAPEDAPAVLVVNNHGFLDRTIYLIRGSLRMRMGVAPGKQTTELVIPERYVRDRTYLRFEADPVGSRAVVSTREELVFPGTIVTLTIVDSN
jgi:hypothetical protein